MITNYNILRQTYIVDGFTQALSFIQQLQQNNQLSQALLTNFYCYITIQAQFKSQQILTILNNCLQSQDCYKSLRALTLYHISSVYFKQKQYNKCRQICQQILQQFIGMYYSIQMRLDKSHQQIQLAQQLQQIIYYVFLMLAYISRKQDKINQSNVLLDASKRIIKDRKDVFSLTTKTTITKMQQSQQYNNNNNKKNSPQSAQIKKGQKQNVRKDGGIFLKHSKSMNTY